MLLDGVRVTPNARTAVKAGYHKIAVATTPRSPIESEAVLQSFVPGGGGGFAGGGVAEAEEAVAVVVVAAVADSRLPVLTIQRGPWLDTPSRQRIFVCHPANEADEIPCATKIFSEVARRAFRRPVTDADLSAPLAFFKTGKGQRRQI